MAETRMIPGVGIVRRNDDGTFEVVSSGQSSPNTVKIGQRDPAKVAAESRAQAAESRAERDQQLQEEAAARERAKTNPDGSPKASPASETNPYQKAQGLRGDYNQETAVKAYTESLPMFMTALHTEPNGAGDLLLITAYAKLTDPTTGVREGETANAQNASPWVEQKIATLKGQLDSTGGKFPDAVRENYRRELLGLMKQRNEAYNQQRLRYKADAEANGIDPARVIGPHVGTGSLDDIVKHFAPDDKSGAAVQTNLAGGGDKDKSIPIPEDMQAEYRAYLDAHKGRLDPEDYASFRARLDEKYGFPTPPEKLDEYRNYARDASQPGHVIGGTIPPVKAAMTGRDKFNASIFNDALTGGKIGSFLMGAGGMGGAADEIVGTGKALLTGGDISTNIAQMDAMRQAAARANPGSSLLGNATGALLAGVATGGLAPGLEAAAGTAPGALGIGAGYGAISGALDNNNDRLGGAFMGTGAGLLGGAAGKYVVGPAAEWLTRTSGGQALAEKIAQMRGKTFEPAPQLTPVEASLSGATPGVAAVTQNLRDAARLGLPYSLADADPKLRMLAGAASRKSVDARALAERTLDPRALGQADRAVSAIDERLAPVTNIEQRGADLLAAGHQAASPDYNLAMERPGPVDPQIDAMLQTPAGREALNRARVIAANEGRDPNTLGFDLDEQGNVVIKNVPSFETLQLAKRGLDSHLEDFRDPITRNLNLRGNPVAQSVENLRTRFNGRLGELNPDYAAGNAEYGKWAQRKDALDLGYGALPATNTPQREFDAALGRFRDYDAALPNSADALLPEAQMGYATAMADRVNQMRMSSNPYDAVYGSPLQQGKVGALFPEGAADFDRTYQLERDMARTRGEVLGGSPTAARLQADEQLNGGLGTAALDASSQMLTGGGLSLGTALNAAKRMTGDSLKIGVGKAGRDRADLIASTLFDTNNPNAIADLVDNMAAKLSGIDARKAAYARRAALFGALGLPAVAPSGT